MLRPLEALGLSWWRRWKGDGVWKDGKSVMLYCVHVMRQDMICGLLPFLKTTVFPSAKQIKCYN